MLEEVRALKHRLGRMISRVQRVRNELERLLQDDHDMQVGVSGGAVGSTTLHRGWGGDREWERGWGSDREWERGWGVRRSWRTAVLFSPIGGAPHHTLTHTRMHAQDMYLARRAASVGEPLPPDLVGLAVPHSQVSQCVGGLQLPCHQVWSRAHVLIVPSSIPQSTQSLSGIASAATASSAAAAKGGKPAAGTMPHPASLPSLATSSQLPDGAGGSSGGGQHASLHHPHAESIAGLTSRRPHALLEAEGGGSGRGVDGLRRPAGEHLGHHTHRGGGSDGGGTHPGGKRHSGRALFRSSTILVRQLTRRRRSKGGGDGAAGGSGAASPTAGDGGDGEVGGSGSLEPLAAGRGEMTCRSSLEGGQDPLSSVQPLPLAVLPECHAWLCRSRRRQRRRRRRD